MGEMLSFTVRLNWNLREFTASYMCFLSNRKLLKRIQFFTTSFERRVTISKKARGQQGILGRSSGFWGKKYGWGDREGKRHAV